ncbi:Os06g0116933, partial [Oryza sativa Japonica Group]
LCSPLAGHVLAFCLPHYPWRHGISAAGSCHAGGSGYAYSTETRRGARCPKGSPDCCVVGKRYPRFMWLTAGIGHAPAIPTLHMCFRRNMELVVELYSGSGWLCLDDGGGGARCRRCNGRIRVVVTAAAVNGRSVVVRVVDECDYVNGCCNEDGFAPPCQDNVGGESLTVWKKLGSTRTGANRSFYSSNRCLTNGLWTAMALSRRSGKHDGILFNLTKSVVNCRSGENSVPLSGFSHIIIALLGI